VAAAALGPPLWPPGPLVVIIETYIEGTGHPSELLVPLSSDMSDAEPSSSNNSRKRSDALQQGPRKKAYGMALHFPGRRSLDEAFISCVTDPLVHHGRHFARTVHALCNVHALLTNGILRMVELADSPEESFTAECVTLRPTPSDLTTVISSSSESDGSMQYSRIS
jgi:hypothetical protein